MINLKYKEQSDNFDISMIKSLNESLSEDNVVSVELATEFDSLLEEKSFE